MDEVFVECEKLDHFGRGLCHVSGKIRVNGQFSTKITIFPSNKACDTTSGLSVLWICGKMDLFSIR